MIGSQSLASLHGQSPPPLVSHPATPSGRPCDEPAELAEAAAASAATAESVMAWDRIAGGLKARCHTGAQPRSSSTGRAGRAGGPGRTMSKASASAAAAGGGRGWSLVWQIPS